MKYDLAALGGSGHRNPSALVGVLRGVIDQVGQDLGNSRKIAQHQQRLRRQHDRQLMFKSVDEGTTRLDRRADDHSDIDRSDLELDLSPRDARDVEQIIDQADQLAELAADDFSGPCKLDWILRAQVKDVNGVADRRQRVAQLMREHRQELVFAAIIRLALFV